MGRLLIGIILLLLAGAACGREPTPTPRATPRPRATAVPVQPATLTATATSNPTPGPGPVVQQGTVIDVANLRAEPSTNALVVGGAQPGQVLDLVAVDASGEWYQLVAGSWIAAFLIEEDLDLPPASGAALAREAAQVTTTARANLRLGPGLSYDTAGIVEVGQTLGIVGQDRTGDWYLLPDGTWIFAQLVDGAPGQLPVVPATPPS